MGEATVPAEQPAPGQEAWIPASDVDTSRARHHQSASRQGSRPPVGLIRPITDRATFAAMRRARRHRSGLIVVAWLDDAASPPPRVAYTITRKVAGAVGRNRLRRRLRELARRSNLCPGAWLVTAAPGAADVPFATLSTWWDEAVDALMPGEAA